jgi:hypothetical protein
MRGMELGSGETGRQAKDFVGKELGLRLSRA